MNYLTCLEGVTDFEETKKILISKNLIVKHDDSEPIFLVKYDKSKCDMDDQDVRRCRGLILEKGTNNLVCVPPPHSEKAELFNQIDINETVFEEFVDGTMINVFKYKGELYMSTRSCIGAYCKYYSNKTFNALFSEIIDLSQFSVIGDNMNLTFILQHPENIIVTKYTQPSITLVYGVTVIDNTVQHHSLGELRDMLKEKDLEFNIPETYKLDHPSKVYEVINKMDQNSQGLILKCYKDNGTVYLRAKIRNEHYNYVRQLKGNSNNKKYLYLDLRKKRLLDQYLKYFSEDSDLFEIYKMELYDTTNNLFNFYQDYYVRRNEDGKRLINFTDIKFEYRPLCIELHNDFKMTKKVTDKRKIINYMNNLPTAKLLFVINYKYRK